ncbi:MAG: hypothetical protein LBE35_10610 [Clostridiales bacterium]|jgi:hypothetical protein|nr:hypothetical protein [Clostridiales bacterium]
MNYEPLGGHGYHSPPPGQGKATAALVLGILSIVMSGVGLVLGIIGIFMAKGARDEGFTGGFATAGMVLSIIGISLSFLGCAILGCILCTAPMHTWMW